MEEGEEIFFKLLKLGVTGKNSNDSILSENIFMYRVRLEKSYTNSKYLLTGGVRFF